MSALPAWLTAVGVSIMPGALSSKEKYFVGCSCLLLCGAMLPVSAANADDLILSRSGTLPILLTVPHGGTTAVPNVPPRSSGTTVTDSYTIEVAEALAKQLENTLGAQPYIVVARFSRQYIDANRPRSEAFDSPEAKPAYDAYHSRIRQFIAQIRQKFPGGALLLDIHAQGNDPDMVHRGTRDGATVTALIRNHGAAALIGPHSVFGALQSKGYKVFPPNTPPGTPPEHRGYSGGYTVHTYGSGNTAGIDAIQLELGRHLRTNARFVVALAESIAIFYKAFLSAGALPQAATTDGLPDVRAQLAATFEPISQRTGQQR